MSYADFVQRMRTVAHQAELSHANSASLYSRLIEIIDAHADPAQVERALFDEYDQTKEEFFRGKAHQVERELRGKRW